MPRPPRLPEWRRGTAAAVVGVALALAAVLGWFAPLDNALRDLRFALLSRAATGSVVFVDIDSASLKSVGVWPWPRRLHAQLLDTLMQLGAREVLFDIDFSAASNATDDAAFAHALDDAGGFAYLAAFRQQQADANGRPQYNLPLPRFLQNAAPVAVNVSLDGAGLVRTYPRTMTIDGQAVPSAAAVLANAPSAPDTPIVIDFSIDPASVARISAADLLSGRVDPARIAGKQVVIGASAVELRDFFVVPRYGILPGAVLQILAAETLKQSRDLVSLGPWPGLALLALLIGAGWRLRRRFGVFQIVALSFASALVAEAAAAALQVTMTLLLDTAALDTGLATFALAAILAEMRKRGEQKRRAEEQLRYLATHDPLTGALSRPSLVTAIAGAAARAGELAVIVLDLHRFGAINDTLGHARGDELLRQVALRLEAIAPGATARLGGDNFALVMPEVAPAMLHSLCATIVEHVGFPYELDTHQVTISASAGATLASVSGRDPDTLLAHADMALTAARQRTGAGVELFQPAMHTRLAARQELDARLRQSVRAGEIGLVYQPQVDLATGQVVGVESLSRWSHPELGRVSPERFIPAAEETGLIVEIGRRALNLACAQALRWPQHIRMAVNVSPVQFELSDVAADIAQALTRSGLDPRRLEIEITEGAFVKDPAAVGDRLEAIRQLGVKIALDDFGTGYSSLAYLGRLPIDSIKIDQSFVRRLPGDHEARAIIGAILGLARALDKSVVAEGVETADQAMFLRLGGCPIGQGYLFSRPLPAEELHFGPAALAIAS